jgi:hypothetical protein
VAVVVVAVVREEGSVRRDDEAAVKVRRRGSGRAAHDEYEDVAWKVGREVRLQEARRRRGRTVSIGSGEEEEEATAGGEDVEEEDVNGAGGEAGGARWPACWSGPTCTGARARPCTQARGK